MGLTKLLVAGAVFFVTAEITGEIMKDFNLPPEAKDGVRYAVGLVIGKVAHSLL